MSSINSSNELSPGCAVALVVFGLLFVGVIAFEIMWRWLLIDAGLKLLGKL